MVPVAEIADPKNDFNLNLPRYIDSTEPEDLQDIAGHLRGGIPNRDIDGDPKMGVPGLARYWQVLPALRAVLFSPLASARGVPRSERHAGYSQHNCSGGEPAKHAKYAKGLEELHAQSPGCCACFACFAG
jgi:hypothetical protein